jgi:hypothetical protein
MLVGKPQTKSHTEDVDVDVKMILKWIFIERGFEVVEWIHVAQHRDQWRAVVNTVVNLRVL